MIIAHIVEMLSLGNLVVIRNVIPRGLVCTISDLDVD